MEGMHVDGIRKALSFVLWTELVMILAHGARLLFGFGPATYVLAGILLYAPLRTYVFATRDSTSFFRFMLVYMLSVSLTQLTYFAYGYFPAAGVFFITLYLLSKHLVFNEWHIPSLYRHPLFIAVLALKVLAGTFLASSYLTQGVVPIVSQFIQSGLHSPYDAFLNTPVLQTAYPLSPLILVILTISSVVPALFGAGMFGYLLAFTVPILLADIIILALLNRLIGNHEKELLIFYWCSPIVFYVSYMQGQLDIIPIAILFLSLAYLFKKQLWKSAALLGVGIAAKVNVLVALPYIFLYLWRNKTRPLLIAVYTGFVLTLAVYSAYVMRLSPGFSVMLGFAKEEIVQFILQSPFSVGGLSIYVIPFLLIVFALRLTYYTTVNRELLLTSLGVAFIILVVFVPPVSGWFLWSLPFITYFFVKNSVLSRKHLVLYGAAFILYFVVVNPASEVFSVFTQVAPSVAAWPAPLTFISFNHALVVNVGFTLLAALMIMNALGIYSHGIVNRFKNMKPFLIGIAGDSGSGKSTLNALITGLIGTHNTTTLEGDDLHKWQRGDKNWERITHLNPTANRLHEDLRTVKDINRKRVFRKKYDHTTGTFTAPEKVTGAKFVLVSGLHSLYLTEMRQHLDLKIFLDPDPDLQLHWKIVRDIGDRGYTKSKVLAQVKKRKTDRKKHIQPQREYADLIIRHKTRKMTAKQVWDPTYDPTLTLELEFKNSAHLEPLLDLLPANVQYKHTVSIQRQILQVRTDISAAEVKEMAYALMPDIDDISENDDPLFAEGTNGIIQLVVLYLISQEVRS